MRFTGSLRLNEKERGERRKEKVGEFTSPSRRVGEFILRLNGIDSNKKSPLIDIRGL